MPSTEGADYAARLSTLSSARWKQLLDVQRPYRWNLRRLDLGPTLDVGCGIGRNLHHLPAGSLGVDHNESSVAIARDAGLTALTTEEFAAHPPAPGTFRSMLLAHVLEHMTPELGREVVSSYLPYVREQVVVICPQERGYASDATHVTFLDAEAIGDLLRSAGLAVRRAYSFPFPRPVGKVFTYNETVVVARVAPRSGTAQPGAHP